MIIIFCVKFRILLKYEKYRLQLFFIMESHACRNLILQMRAELESEWISLNSEIWVRFLFLIVYLILKRRKTYIVF